MTFLASCSSTDNGTGEQGKWCDFTYTIPAESDPTGKEMVKTQTKVIVQKSIYIRVADRIAVQVVWEAENTGKETNVFSWTNKYLTDKEGRLFKPSQGYDSGEIHPLDKTGPLTVLYNLPGSVNTNDLYWGLYHGDTEHGLKYRIKLTPTTE